MRFLDLSLPTPAENLACDEALLTACEAGATDEVLRFWQSERYFVALGYANRAASEVNLGFCEANAIPILRRCTGGGTVLQGPGCLNYSLVLRHESTPALHTIPATNDYILGRHQQALDALLAACVEKQGHTDLALGGVKFSGNAQRRGKRCLLFHGSFLLSMDLELIARALPMPSRQPDYRLNRSHHDFLLNLKLPAEVLKSALTRAWEARQTLEHLPSEQIAMLVREKYAQPSWNLKF